MSPLPWPSRSAVIPAVSPAAQTGSSWGQKHPEPVISLGIINCPRCYGKKRPSCLIGVCLALIPPSSSRNTLYLEPRSAGPPMRVPAQRVQVVPHSSSNKLNRLSSFISSGGGIIQPSTRFCLRSLHEEPACLLWSVCSVCVAIRQDFLFSFF